MTFLTKGKSIIAGHSCFKPAQGMLTCSGVNVAVLRNEHVSMRGERADAPRDGIVVGSHHQYQQQLEPRVRSRYCGRARAHGTTNPNQYHIFATLPTSVQLPLPFWPTVLYRHTQRRNTNSSAQAAIFTNSTHGRSGQRLQPVYKKYRVEIPAGKSTILSFFFVSVLSYSEKMPRRCLHLGNKRVLPHTLQFIFRHHPVI